MLGYIPELATTNEAVAKNVPVQSVQAGRQRCQRRGTAVRLPPPTRMGGGGGGDADEGNEDAGPDPLDEETEAMAQLVRLRAAAKEVADQIAQAEAVIAVFTQKKAVEAKQAIEAKKNEKQWKQRRKEKRQ